MPRNTAFEGLLPAAQPGTRFLDRGEDRIAYDDPAAASDIIALTENLGGPALFLGNSIGAVAAVVASAESRAPINGLVFLGPFVRNVPVPTRQRWMLRAAFGGPWARLAWMSYFPKFFPSRDEDYAEHRDAVGEAMTRPGHGRAFRATHRTSQAPSEAALAHVQTPGLVVMGPKDPDFPVSRPRRG